MGPGLEACTLREERGGGHVRDSNVGWITDREAGPGSRELSKAQRVSLERVAYLLLTAPWAVGQMLQANDS